MKSDWSENKHFERAGKNYVANQYLIIVKAKGVLN